MSRDSLSMVSRPIWLRRGHRSRACAGAWPDDAAGRDRARWRRPARPPTPPARGLNGVLAVERFRPRNGEPWTARRVRGHPPPAFPAFRTAACAPNHPEVSTSSAISDSHRRSIASISDAASPLAVASRSMSARCQANRSSSTCVPRPTARLLALQADALERRLVVGEDEPVEAPCEARFERRVAPRCRTTWPESSTYVVVCSPSCEDAASRARASRGGARSGGSGRSSASIRYVGHFDARGAPRRPHGAAGERARRGTWRGAAGRVGARAAVGDGDGVGPSARTAGEVSPT